jgi:hypothetical protein
MQQAYDREKQKLDHHNMLAQHGSIKTQSQGPVTPCSPHSKQDKNDEAKRWIYSKFRMMVSMHYKSSDIRDQMHTTGFTDEEIDDFFAEVEADDRRTQLTSQTSTSSLSSFREKKQISPDQPITRSRTLSISRSIQGILKMVGLGRSRRNTQGTSDGAVNETGETSTEIETDKGRDTNTSVDVSEKGTRALTSAGHSARSSSLTTNNIEDREVSEKATPSRNTLGPMFGRPVSLSFSKATSPLKPYVEIDQEWTAVLDSRVNEYYYWNKKTGLTTWTNPKLNSENTDTETSEKLDESKKRSLLSNMSLPFIRLSRSASAASGTATSSSIKYSDDRRVSQIPVRTSGNTAIRPEVRLERSQSVRVLGSSSSTARMRSLRATESPASLESPRSRSPGAIKSRVEVLSS